jgi:hypothetical protein
MCDLQSLSVGRIGTIGEALGVLKLNERVSIVSHDIPLQCRHKTSAPIMATMGRFRSQFGLD